MVYNSQHSFEKFKDINEFKELSLGSMYKRLNDFQKRFNKVKIVNPQTDNNEILKENVLDDIADIFNELYYIYKDRYNEEKNDLKAKYTKEFDCRKLRLIGSYQYECEEEKEQQTSKKPDKKDPLKKPTKDDFNKFNE